MRRFLALLLAAHFAALSPTYGATVVINSYRFAASGGGFSYYTSFEGSGIEAGWTFEGTQPNWDSTEITPAEGAHSVKLSAGGSGAIYLISPALTDSGFVFPIYKQGGSFPASPTAFIYRNTAGDGDPTLFLNADGTLTVRLKSGTEATTVGAIPSNVWTWIWIHKTSTLATVGFSTDRAAKPTSGDNFASVSGSGGVDGDMFEFYFSNSMAANLFFDDSKLQLGDPAYP